MKDYKNEMAEFKQYAADTLKIHREELNIRYENMKIDKETVNKGHEEHQKIFEKELSDKSSSLLSGNNDALLQEKLDEISKTYVDKLSVNNS